MNFLYYLLVSFIFLNFSDSCPASISTEEADEDRQSRILQSGVWFIDPVDRKMPSISTGNHHVSLGRWNLLNVENWTGVPVIIQAEEEYLGGGQNLKKDDCLTVLYYFQGYKSLKEIDNVTPMALPKGFKPMSEKEGVVRFANLLLPESSFTDKTPLNTMIQALQKANIKSDWIKEIFWKNFLTS